MKTGPKRATFSYALLLVRDVLQSSGPRETAATEDTKD